MKYEVDFHDIFHRMPEPIGVCDEDGWIHALNGAAVKLLGPVGDQQRLILGVRETVRQMRMTEGGLQEFFMADVEVEGTRRKNISLSLLPLRAGGYRVAFEVGPSSGLPANVRILESLVNVNRHLELFRSPDKVIELFAASFSEVFPDYAFHLEIERPRGGPLVHQHAGWAGDVARMDIVAEEYELPHVPADARFWAQSERGYRIDLNAVSTVAGAFQVERRDDTRFRVEERDAFETFAQQLAIGLHRLWQDDDFSLVAPIIDQLDAVVVVCDARRRIRVCNRTFEALVYDENVIGRDILEFFSESSRAKLRTAAATVMAGSVADAFDAAIVNGDGSSSSQVILTIQVAPNAAARDGGASQGFIVTAQHSDMSLLELEERLTRAEHLMNLGQLATGVAHELKNPLTSILNYADYLLRKYEDSLFEERDRERLRRIIEGVEHIDAFVQDLMTLARPSESQSERVDLHSAIRESAALCEITLREFDTRLDLSFVDTPAELYGLSSQLAQIFVNLFTNAARAMPNGTAGVIAVETAISDEHVMCRVIDNAAGMSEETRARIFEPFFTTRDSHGGTGLGLAIVQTIVQRHRGEIDVESKQGVGTTFTLTFPRAHR